MFEPTRLLQFARELQRAVNFGELLEMVTAEVRRATGYQHVFLFVLDEDQRYARLLAAAGQLADKIWETAPVLPTTGDAMIEEILSLKGPVVVIDAETDPRTNKEQVALMRNRTIINIPLALYDAPLGAMGVGTFGDEGPRPPTPEQLEYFVAMANQVGVAAGRLRLLEAKSRVEKEKAALERRLLLIQKLESLGLLAGGIAHDFNNLLMVVRSNAQFIAEGTLAKEQRADLQALISAADRGTDLTRQLLAMGRQQPQKLEAADLNARLAELVTMLGRLMPANITLDLLPAHHLPTVLGDGTQLDQVFMNLCVNARDAMPSGGRITIETEQVVLNGAYVAAHPWAKPGRYVLTTVTDTGSGMAPDVLERIFEPFYTTKAAGQGTGLGLAVTYGIVTQHGGMVNVYSEVGVGTSFKVYLPAYDRSASAVGNKLVGAVAHGGERILVAEDDANVRRVITRILERAGYKVVAVADGEAAVAEARQSKFDLIMLDTIMPRLSGKDAFALIEPIAQGTCFLFSSGYAAELLPNALQQTKVEALQKPYDPDELLRTVRRVLDDRVD
jgi:signal transduction histidine kinase